MAKTGIKKITAQYTYAGNIYLTVQYTTQARRQIDRDRTHTKRGTYTHTLKHKQLRAHSYIGRHQHRNTHTNTDRQAHTQTNTHPSANPLRETGRWWQALSPLAQSKRSKIHSQTSQNTMAPCLTPIGRLWPHLHSDWLSATSPPFWLDSSLYLQADWSHDADYSAESNRVGLLGIFAGLLLLKYSNTLAQL